MRVWRGTPPARISYGVGAGIEADVDLAAVWPIGRSGHRR